MGEISVPDGGYGWIIVLSSFILNFMVVGIPRSFGVVYIVILETFEATATEVAWIHSLFNTMRMVLGPVSSILCNKYKARKVVTCGALVFSVGVMASCFANKVFHLYITYGFIAGIGGSCLFAPSMIVVGEYFNKKKGKAMSISSMGGGIGTLIFAPVFTFLMGYYGLNGGFLIIGGVCLHTVVAGMLLRPLRHKPKEEILVMTVEVTSKVVNSEDKVSDEKQCYKENSDNLSNKFISTKTGSEQSHSNDSIEAQVQLKSNDTANNEINKKSCVVPPLLTNSTFIIYCLCLGTMPFCLQTMLLFIADYAKEHSFTKNERALLLSVIGITDISGRIIAGLVFDLKAIRTNRRIVLTVTGILFALTTMSISLAHSLPLLFIACSFHGLFEGVFHAQRATILSEFVPINQVALSIGWMTFFQGIGNLIGPVLGGMIRDYSQSYEAVFLFGGSCFLVFLVLFLLDYLIKGRIICKLIGKR